jgi:hypothetical protein
MDEDPGDEVTNATVIQRGRPPKSGRTTTKAQCEMWWKPSAAPVSGSRGDSTNA